MYSKTIQGYSKILFLFLLIFIAPQVSGARQGVRRRNNEDAGFEEINLDSCSTTKCAAACVEDSCSADKFCVEHFTAGKCCQKTKCSGCTPSLRAECPDPCEKYTSCKDGEICKAIQFRDLCCPKAVCSQKVPEIISIDTTTKNTPPSNSCEGVVCGKDPCNCPIQSDPYCGYDCYDPFLSSECCPTSTHGECKLWCYDAPLP